MVVIHPLSGAKSDNGIRRQWITLALSIPAMLFTVGGCIELQEALQGALIEAVLGGSAPVSNGDDDPPVNDMDPLAVATVTLTASNPTPQLNEQVELRCSVTGGSAGTVSFSFQPSQELSSINPDAGTASLIIDQTDLGASQAFTCSATNAAGTGPPSNTVVILATPLAP